MFSRSV